MAGLTEFYCGWNEPSHASQFKWLEYTFKTPLECNEPFSLARGICNNQQYFTRSYEVTNHGKMYELVL